MTSGRRRAQELTGAAALIMTATCLATAWCLIAGTVAVLAVQGRATTSTYVLGAVFVAAFTGGIVARYRRRNRA